MLIKQEPKYLKRRLCHPGPFIVYYNSEIDDYNKSLVFKMKTLAKLYCEFHFLEINWSEYIKYIRNADEKLFNQVHLFYENKPVKVLEFPENAELEELIISSIKYYNLKIINLCETLGTRPTAKTYKKIENMKDIVLKKQYLKSREWLITGAKNYKMKKLIKIPEKDEVINILSRISEIFPRNIIYEQNNTKQQNDDPDFQDSNDNSKLIKVEIQKNYSMFNSKQKLLKNHIINNKISILGNYKKMNVKRKNLINEPNDIYNEQLLKSIKVSKVIYINKSNSKIEDCKNFTNNILYSSSNNSETNLPFKWVVYDRKIISEKDFLSIQKKKKLNIKRKNNKKIAKNKIFDKSKIKTNDCPFDLSKKT